MEPSNFLGFELRRYSWDNGYTEVFNGDGESVHTSYGITSYYRAALWALLHFWKA